MTPTANLYHLESIARDHAIGAGVFIPFVIHRLRATVDAALAELQVQLRDIGQPGTRSSALRLSWASIALPEQPPAVQDHIVTEWAALGVACAVVLIFAGLRVSAVSMRDDSFDYWVSDGEREFGLEVSGTLLTDLETRHEAKVQQLQMNPYGVGGYVVAVSFVRREVIFSYHPAAEIRQ